MAANRHASSSTAEFIADFHGLPPRYTILRPVGRGSFGTLVSAKDNKTGKTVAIKRVEGGGGTMGTDRHESKKLLREMRLLQHFQNENVMTLYDILTPPGEGGGGGGGSGGASGGSSVSGSSSDGAGGACAGGVADMVSDIGDGSADCTNGTGGSGSTQRGWRQIFYLVQDLMDTDLHRVIQSAAKGQQALTDNHIRCFTYQVVRGIYACHSAQVLHRDLKPSNLLVNKDCTLRIGDFGLARGVDEAASEANQLTEYVVTRWYRAPELLCGNESYGLPIDLWSIGCILAEMLGRTPLFPGRDVLTQLKLIVTIVGVPDHAALKTFVNNDKAIDFILQIAKQAPPPQPLHERYPNAPPGAVDLLSRLLAFDPSKRISAADALTHPFLKPLHDLNTEPTATPFDFSFEAASDPELKELLEAEVRRFHPDRQASRHASKMASPVTPPKPQQESAVATGAAVAGGSANASQLPTPSGTGGASSVSSAGVATVSTSTGKTRLPPAATRGGVSKKRQR